MKYKVIMKEYLVDLEEHVNRNMEGGWKPLGGVSYIQYGVYKEKYLQAMAKE
jgi:hypothetical protein